MDAVDLVHACLRADWEAGDDPYVPPGYAEVGFIHLSRPDQVCRPATRLYRGRRDLVLLVVSSTDLGPALRWEPSAVPAEGGELFPHLYQPLARSLVHEVVDYPCGDDGSFDAPATFT